MKKIYLIVFLLMFVTSVVNAQTRTASVSGPWNSTVTWGGVSVPSTTNDVFINDGVTVVFDLTSTVLSLTVGQGTSGTLTLGNGGANENLTVTGNVVVNSGATILPADDGIFTVGGNLTNSGTFDLNNGGSDYDIVFNGTANQTISGAGGTTDFNLITINNTGAAATSIVEVSSTNFTVPAGFLTLTDGIFKVSGSFVLSNAFFTAAGYTIPAIAGLWLNNANATVTAQGTDVTLNGSLQVTAGTYNVGNANDVELRYGNNSSLTVDGGTLNIAAAFNGVLATNVISFTMSSGTILLSTSDHTIVAGRENFEISAAGSSFTMSGGTIIIQRVSTDAGTNEWDMRAGTVSITGGTVQFGNASTPAASTFEITTASITPNVVISTTNSPTLSLNGTTTFTGNVTINTGATFNANSADVSVSGNWTNNGTFTPGTQTTTFNGAAAQTIGGTSATTFNGLTINNTSGGVSLSQDANVSAAMTFTSGIVTSTSANLLTFNAGSSTPGGSSSSFVDGPVAKVGATAFTFPVGKSGAGLRTIGISAPTVSSTFTAEFFRANPQSAVGSAMGAGVVQVSACEYWVLDRTGTGDATVILSWAASSTCNGASYVTDLPTLRVTRWTGALWEDRTNAGTTGTTTAGTITSDLVTTFSPFVLASSSSTTNPLPVKLSNIRAFEKQQGIQIEWTAYQEENLSRYSIERSANGITYTSIGEVASRNSAVETNYGFFDASPVQGVNFYRLRSIDFDNKSGYSSIVKVNLDKSVKDISLYPNPATSGFISFQGADLAKGNYTVRIYNSAGMQVMGQSFTHTGGAINQTLKLPAGVRSGMYSLQLINADVKLMSKTFMVQ